MRVTIEDLEALKELGEELEENHVETERAMQDEISTCSSTGWNVYNTIWILDEKDVQLAERQQRIETLEEVCQDLERTITRFRELVLQLERSVAWTPCAKIFAATEVNDSASSRHCVRKRRTHKPNRQQRHHRQLRLCL